MFSGTRIDSGAGQPLFAQICLATRQHILSGALGNGTLLSSEAQIEDLFDVSRITARRAIRELVDIGLAESYRGLGTAVAMHGALEERRRQRGAIEGLLENLLVIGNTTRIHVRSFGFVPASAHVAAALQVRKSSQVRRVVRILLQDPQPLCLIDAHMPPNIARLVGRRGIGEGIHRHIAPPRRNQNRTGGTISIILRGQSKAQQLCVPAESPLFRIERTLLVPRARAVELVVILYPGQKHSYHMSLVQTQRIWRKREQTPDIAALRLQHQSSED